MPRIARMIIEGEPTVYHVVSRSVLDGYIFREDEKDFFFKTVRRLAKVYFTEIFGLCMMGDHFHLLVRMLPASDVSGREIRQRLERFSGKEDTRPIDRDRIRALQVKWSRLPEFLRQVKQEFSRYYNKRHGRKGFLWGERFKSVIVEPGAALLHCLAYIDLNPVRAGLVEKPEDYRWNSIGYHIQTGNCDGLFSMDFGLAEFKDMDSAERLTRYRRFLDEILAGFTVKAGAAEGNRPPKPDKFTRFQYRTRYFSDAGIIGGKEFVQKTYRRFRHVFVSKNEKIPKPIAGLDGLYSMKRLTE